MAFYKKRITKPDTYEQILERHCQRKAAETALLETMFKFHPLTAENFEAADAYRKQRIQELKKAS